jgi:hypothetical protein
MAVLVTDFPAVTPHLSLCRRTRQTGNGKMPCFASPLAPGSGAMYTPIIPMLQVGFTIFQAVFQYLRGLLFFRVAVITLVQRYTDLRCFRGIL